MRLKLTALMISLVLLCGCAAAGRDRERVETLRARVSGAESISFRAVLEADDGETRERYVLLCTRSGGETELCLLYPELIGGVTARLSENGAVLRYDDLSFETGALDAEGLRPIAAPDLILSALKTGIVSQLRRESLDGNETLAFRVLSVKGYFVDVWIDADSLVLYRAEILSGDRAAIRCDVFEWKLDTKEG